MTEGQDTHHDKTRAYPTGDESILRSLVTRAGLPVIGYEYKVLDSNRTSLWYDVAVTLNGRLALIDLEDSRHPQHRIDKEGYCKQHDIPVLFLPIGEQNTLAWEAAIEIWLLTRA